ncbi:MAG: aspartate/glutamate racemase family protein [Pseudomonadota bacterium]
MIRIWHQSMTTLEEQPGYAKLMQAHAQKVCGPDTVVDLHGVMPGTHAPDLAPIQSAGLAWLAEMNSLQIVENVIRAQDEGYDAVAMSCFSDPQLDICRSLVDIPVVSAFETSLLVASTSARAFGLLVPTDSAVRNSRKRVKNYGFDHRVALVSACEPQLTEYDMEHGFEGGGDMVEKLVANIRRMGAAGADMVIPAEGVLNALLVKNGVTNVDGVPVFDSFGAVMATAEMLVRLHRTTGLRNARKGGYTRPDPKFVKHSRDVAIRALTAAAHRAA